MGKMQELDILLVFVPTLFVFAFAIRFAGQLTHGIIFVDYLLIIFVI